jgi:hypothetical protein
MWYYCFGSDATVYRMFHMSQTPRLADRLRQLVDEMRAEDERQQARINALLDQTQHHLRLLEMDLKDD